MIHDITPAQFKHNSPITAVGNAIREVYSCIYHNIQKVGDKNEHWCQGVVPWSQISIINIKIIPWKD